jgi:hypothetical protein
VGQVHRFDVVSGQHSAYTIEYGSDKGQKGDRVGPRFVSGQLQPKLLSFPPQPICIHNSEFHCSFLSNLVFLCSVRRLLVTATVVPSSPTLVTPMKEAPCSSETSVLTRATRRSIPEDTILHSRRRENLKSYILFLFKHNVSKIGLFPSSDCWTLFSKRSMP